MRIGILGSGHIGGTAARLFIEAGHEVMLGDSTSSEELTGAQAEALLHGAPSGAAAHAPES